MVKITLLGLSAVCFALGNIGQWNYGREQAKPEAVVVSRHYAGVEGSTVDGLGVCKITPEAVECWDMDRVPSQSLTEEVRSRLTSKPQSDLSFQPRKKNRYLAIRVHIGSKPFLPYTYPLSLQFLNPDGSTLILSPVAASPSEAEASYDTVLDDRAHSPSTTMSYREGAHAQLGKATVELGPITENPNYVGFSFPTARHWRVVVGCPSIGAPSLLMFEFIGSDDNAVRYVDRLGNPVADSVYGSWFEDMVAGKIAANDSRLFQTAMLWSSGPNLPDAFFTEVAIDPKWVASLRVTLLKQRHVTVTGFPLDPK